MVLVSGRNRLAETPRAQLAARPAGTRRRRDRAKTAQIRPYIRKRPGVFERQTLFRQRK
jgi:hypothetical protein